VQALPHIDLTAFHGTDIDSARNLLRGDSLSASIAAARKIDGPSGFFLAIEQTDAEFFAMRRSPGGVLQFDFSADAVRQLRSSGMIQQPIPRGLKAPFFRGDELIIPPSAFDLFNDLRRLGEILVNPAP
jgi:hypothetical protein